MQEWLVIRIIKEWVENYKSEMFCTKQDVIVFFQRNFQFHSKKGMSCSLGMPWWGNFPICYFPTHYYRLHREEERLWCQQIRHLVESCGWPQSTLPTCKLQEGVTLHPGMRGKTTALKPQHTANLTTITQSFRQHPNLSWFKKEKKKKHISQHNKTQIISS